MLYTSEKLNEILVYEENQKSIYLFLSQVSNGVVNKFFSSLELLFKKQTIDKDLPKIVTININI